MWHVLSFSGGKDSTALLFMLLERGMPLDQIIFVDFGKEFPQIYEHIELVKEAIRPLTIDVVKLDFEYYLYKKPITKGKRKGQYGYGWPNYRARWCTRLKIRALTKAIRKSPFVKYVGITADEQSRGEDGSAPLVDFQMTSQDTLQYCYKKGFTFGNLYQLLPRTGCYCCPLKGISEYKQLQRHFPHLWQDIKDMHSKQHKEKFTFRFTPEELERR